MEDVKINNLTSKLSDETKKYLESNQDVAREVYNVLNGIADKAGTFKALDKSLMGEVQDIAQLLGADKMISNAAKRVDDIIVASRNNVSSRFAKDVEQQQKVRESIKVAVGEMGDAIKSKLEELDAIIIERTKLAQSKAATLEKTLQYAAGLESQVQKANEQKDAALKRALHFGAETKRTREELDKVGGMLKSTTERKDKSLNKALFYNREFNRVNDELTTANKAVADAQEEIRALQEKQAELRKHGQDATKKALDLYKKMTDAESKLANANRLRSIATQKALAYSKQIKSLTVDNDNYSKSLTAYEKAIGTFFKSDETLKLIGAQNLDKLKKEFTASVAREKASAKTISEQIREINTNYKNEIIRRAVYEHFGIALFEGQDKTKDRGEVARDELEVAVLKIQERDVKVAIRLANQNKLKKNAKKDFVENYPLTQGSYAQVISEIMADVNKIVPVTKEEVANIIESQKDNAGIGLIAKKAFRLAPKRIVATALSVLVLVVAGATAAAHYIPRALNAEEENKTLVGVIDDKDQIISDKDTEKQYDVNLVDYTGKIRSGVDTLLYTQDSANQFVNNNTVAQTSADGKIVAYTVVRDIAGVDAYINTINAQVDKATEIAVFDTNDQLVGGKFAETLKTYQDAIASKDYATVETQLGIVQGYVNAISGGNEDAEIEGYQYEGLVVTDPTVTNVSYVNTARTAYAELQDYIVKQYKDMLDVINTPSYSFDFTAEDILAYKTELNDGFTGNVKNVLSCNYDRQSGNVTILTQISKDKLGRKTTLGQISYTIDAGRASVTLNDIMTLPKSNETRTEFTQNLSGLSSDTTVSMAVNGNIVVGNAQISYNFNPKVERVGNSWQATYSATAIAVMFAEDGSVIGVKPIEIKSTSINKYSTEEFTEAEVRAKLQSKLEQEIRTKLNVSEVEQNVETDLEND